ncbi:hypothetical protein NON20_20535 [Synechocystis sp. B12]|nr:hypothetical protein NON20_20535 [Synechocystis sp. B12]
MQGARFFSANMDGAILEGPMPGA